ARLRARGRQVPRRSEEVRHGVATVRRSGVWRQTAVHAPIRGAAHLILAVLSSSAIARSYSGVVATTSPSAFACTSTAAACRRKRFAAEAREAAHCLVRSRSCLGCLGWSRQRRNGSGAECAR